LLEDERMRHASRRGRRSCRALVALVAVAGCHGQVGAPPPPDGVLTLSIAASASPAEPLQLTSASLGIERLTVLGDVAPDARAMVAEAHIDLLSTGKTLTFMMLPQGLYSRVQFRFEELSLQGSWRGTPLSVHLDSDNGELVDLRSAAGVEVTPGHDGSFAVTVDDNSWFAGDLLDSATQAQGQILVDALDNTAVGSQLFARVPASFSLQNPPVP
jgi:hypothetical protein